MNAKKIMGAVLVALLAAALFVGAGAAATNYGTAFESQNVTGVPTGDWYNGANVVVISADGIVGPVAVAGTYTKGEDSIYFTKPTATYTVIGDIGVNYTVANGGNVYNGSVIDLKVTALNKSVDVNYILVTYPNGSVLNESASIFNDAPLTDKGTYKIQAIFDDAKFVSGVNNGLLLDTLNSFTFTVIDDSDATITASVDSVYAGESVKLTITGVPGTVYLLNTTDLDIPTNQYVVLEKVAEGYKFTMPNNGVAEFAAAVNATVTKKATIVLKYETATPGAYEAVEDAKIEITVSEPVITLTLGANSYFIGNAIELSGSSTFAVDDTDYTFNISGVNFKSTAFTTVTWKEEGKTWKVTLATHNVKEVGTGKALDVGTYTIEILTPGNTKPVKTITVALKQPFISIVDAPEVVEQDTEAEFVINAEAVSAGVGIQAYLFGTNYFKFFTVANGGVTQDEPKDIPNQFTVTLTEETTYNMSTGQYFMVFQHPMYDEHFNVTAAGSTIKEDLGAGYTDLFNVYDRQTANAAQALCDALDSQNFDDMYVKYSFFVVAEGEASYSISEIPTEVTQGTTITISGVDTANDGEDVVVQMLSTAFAAVPKETAGSAAFVLVTTTVAEDGTWEVTLDTSDLNVDEYALTVKIADDLKKSVTVNVVEAADEPVTPDTPDTPVTPDTPDEPVAPATPGFGALAALAGLGAVAVLLLRR